MTADREARAARALVLAQSDGTVSRNRCAASSRHCFNSLSYCASLSRSSLSYCASLSP
jgi:hypothetical protein